MSTNRPPSTILADCKTILGQQVKISNQSAWRDLWPVTAEDGGKYFLKRLWPWRNLPLSDEAEFFST